MSIGQIFGDIGYLFAHSWQLFLQGIASTLILSIVGTVVGLIIGVLLAFG
jgi:ABC-type amino acid transport system permease subunit